MSTDHSRWIVSAYCLSLVVAMFWRPELASNEEVYLIGSRRILEPAFLAGDWTLGTSPFAFPFGAFNVLVAPLWLLLDDPVQIVLVCRLATWLLLGLALLRIVERLGLAPWQVALGFTFWLVADGQSLAAREWLFRGFEPKAAAYTCLLWALLYAMRGRRVAAGFLAGLAAVFHVLVGGYGLAALGVAVLVHDVRRGKAGLAGIARFGAAALPFVSAILVMAFVYLKAGESAVDPAQVDWIMVEFRNAHHLDPGHFLGRWHWLGLPLLALTLFGYARYVPRDAGAIMVPFLAVLAALFLGGCLAYLMGALSVLRFYPFRVGDTLLPLFFWLLLPVLLQRAASALGAARGTRAFTPWLATGLLAAVFLAYTPQLVAGPRQAVKTLRSWRHHLSGAGDPFARTAGWIRGHVEADALFLSPPCQDDFWIEAERATVVQMKLAPSNELATEWFLRLLDVNGGRAIEAVSHGVCPEITANYRRLSRPHVEQLAVRYGATHYLVDRERPEFSDRELFAREGWWIYALR
jgi:hypothetical protein